MALLLLPLVAHVVVGHRLLVLPKAKEGEGAVAALFGHLAPLAAGRAVTAGHVGRVGGGRHDGHGLLRRAREAVRREVWHLHRHREERFLA